MAVTQNSPVQFYYIPEGTTGPEEIDENTIYFNANTKQIFVGNVLIAAQNPRGEDIEGFIRKDAAEIINELLIRDDESENIIKLIKTNENKIGFFQQDAVSLTQLQVATPEEDEDAATKKYVDDNFASKQYVDTYAIPTWIVTT